MATLTFVDFQNEVFDHTGLDSTDANNLIRVKRWLNYIQQDICARWPWNFLRSRENIVTVIDKKDGTVSVTSGSTSVTGVASNFLAGDVGKYIQFLGANDWYRITAVGSTTALTIDNPYQPTVSASGVTYIIRQFFYSLSSACDRIADIKNWNSPLKLDELFPRDVDAIRPNPQSTNTSYGFFPYGYDASNNVQIVPYPYPSDARLLEIKTFKRPTDMVAGTDLPTIPNKWAHIIAFGANAVAFAYLRKFDMASQWTQTFEGKIKDMMAQERTSEDLAPVLASIDSSPRSGFLNMKDQYPSAGGGA